MNNYIHALILFFYASLFFEFVDFFAAEKNTLDKKIIFIVNVVVVVFITYGIFTYNLWGVK